MNGLCLDMLYSVIDLREFRCWILRDKKSVARLLGISVVTLDKRLNGEGVYMQGRYIIGRGDLVRSNRGVKGDQ
jgi:hypothetical protein